MKEQISIEQLAPYLPYGLQIINEKSGKVSELQAAYNEGDELNLMFVDQRNSFTYKLWPLKPLLIPLSEFDLSYAYNEINEFHTLGYDNGLFNDAFSDGFSVEYLPYNTMVVLLKHHFDVFGLIERGLALNKLDVK